MRILVLQLARFGDIYQTWPTFRGLKRKFPDGELHILVRERFKAATEGLEGVTVHALPTAEILRPLLEGGSLADADQELKTFLGALTCESFDQIINLSFSPVSSYLTDFLASSRTEVRGYTRHADGHFHIPDDTSSYFHAQVGIGRGNRYHVTEIFASVAGVDLVSEDFQGTDIHGPRHGVVAHLGASTEEKRYPPELWVETLREFAPSDKAPVTLIGSGSERGLSETVEAQLHNENVRNFVGQTQLNDLFSIVGTASLLIGADSAPIHIAALTSTPVLNISSSAVNFWETGPLSGGSRVLYHNDSAKIKPLAIAREAQAMLRGEMPIEPVALREQILQPFTLHGLAFPEFRWELIQALYTGSTYPAVTAREDRLAFQRLFELSELALQQLARWNHPPERQSAARILAQVDQMLGDVARLNANVEPVIQWFETQRLRIPPGSPEDTLARTVTAFQDLFWVVSVYRENCGVKETAQKAIALCQECAPEIREHNMHAVSDSFQSLVSALQELARHSTKVADASWSSVLDEMNTSLANRDFVALADFLEWKMIPALNAAMV
jgi:heptosyltransferase-3